MKISILIPCYNEELSIEKCILSCVNQTRQPDEIIVVDDCSKDNTAKILAGLDIPVLKVVRTPKNTGGKSHAQEYGLQFVTGDIFITTDGDTVLKNDFVDCIEKDMKNKSIFAISGHVKSLRYNWITACRALDYSIAQNIDKVAQDYLNFVFVIPGAAGAFRTDAFKSSVIFTHDTITEDLDFTYRFHKMGYKIKYDKNAICYTQDPTTLSSYMNQMRRWIGGGWQCLMKHIDVPTKPGMALELSLMYIEGLIYSTVAFIIPVLNLYMGIKIFFLYCILVSFLCMYGAIKEKRLDLLFAMPCYVFLKYVNAYLFIEQFFGEVVFKKKNLVWFKPERVSIKTRI